MKPLGVLLTAGRWRVWGGGLCEATGYLTHWSARPSLGRGPLTRHCFHCGLTEGKAHAALCAWGLPPQGRPCLVHPDTTATACPWRGLGQVTWPHYASVSALVKSWAHWGHPDSRGNDDLSFRLLAFLKAARRCPG